uniref:Apolipoprotein C-I n=2 Tax=Canis lupus familiaris TaxID=9615 RepID=A0A8C0M3U3_CANLF
MRLILSLPVLVVVLSMVLEGPAPAQAAGEISSTFERIPDKLKEFGNTLEDKARAAIESIKKSDIPAKTRLGTFSGFGRAGKLVFGFQESEGASQNC